MRSLINSEFKTKKREFTRYIFLKLIIIMSVERFSLKLPNLANMLFYETQHKIQKVILGIFS